jgi:hypothetical protein
LEPELGLDGSVGVVYRKPDSRLNVALPQPFRYDLWGQPFPVASIQERVIPAPTFLIDQPCLLVQMCNGGLGVALRHGPPLPPLLVLPGGDVVAFRPVALIREEALV